MIIPRPLKRPCEKQISAMSRTEKGRTCQTRKQKGLIIILNQGKKKFTPNQNFGHNNSRNLPKRKFQGSNSKGNPQQNPTITRNKEFTNNHNNYVKNNERKESIKC